MHVDFIDGDLVKMKYAMFWMLKSNPHVSYTEDVATVVKAGTHILEVMWPDGTIDRRDKDFFEIVN
jgi:hypothetical protein